MATATWYNLPKLVTDIDERIETLEEAVGTMEPAVAIATIGVTTNLPAVPGTFADLAASVTYITSLRAATEVRLDTIEAKIDLLITNLRAAGIITV